MKNNSNLRAIGAAIVAIGLFAVTNASYGQFFGNGTLTTASQIWDNPGGSTAGTSMQYYDLLQFSVTTTGLYTFEMSSLNTAGAVSNALDTYLRVYANTFNPVTPGAGIANSDDFTGTLTILPGPFAGQGYTTASTGFTGTQPGSRILNLNLTAGTTYFLVLTSFRNTDFVSTTTTAQAVGSYVFGINGVGTVNAVPEPTTTALLIGAAGALGLGVWRKRRAA